MKIRISALLLLGAGLLVAAESADQPLRRDFSLSGKDSIRAEAMTEFAFSFLPRTNPEESRKAFFAALERDPEASPLVAVAETFFNEGNGERIVEIAKRHPEASALAVLTAVRTMKDHPEEAVELLRRAADSRLEADSFFSRPRGAGTEREIHALACVVSLLTANLADRGKYAEADSLLEKARAVPGLSGDPLLLQTMLAYYDAAKEKAPENSWRPDWLLGSHKEKYAEKFRETLEQIRESVRGEKFLPTRLNPAPAVEILRKAGEKELLRELFASPLLSEPGSPRVYRILADYYAAEGDHVNAARARAMELRFSARPPEESRYRYALDLLRAGETEAGVEALEWCIVLGVDDDLTLNLAATAYVELGQYGKALAKAEKMSETRMKYRLAAVICRLLERNGDSLAAARKLATFPPPEDAGEFRADQMLLADAAFRNGEIDLMEKTVRELLEKTPEDAEALNFLGYTLADANLRLAEAEVLIRKALKLDPENPAYLDSLAWVLYRAARFAEADKEIRRALAASGDEPDGVILDHAGDIAFALGDRKRAREMWEKALSSNSSELKPETVRRKINHLKD